MSPVQIFTIGHSTHPLEEFIELLRVHRIRRIADVRRFPGSRRYPHFNRESLEKALGDEDIAYVHMQALGGRRVPHPDSRNTGLRNEMFRGYADHMETEEFRNAIDELLRLAAERPTAIMCAEGNRHKCHRSLIADHLLALGHAVRHIQGKGEPAPHTYTAAAVVEGNEVRYPGQTIKN